MTAHGDGRGARPGLSVIVPVYNGGGVLDRCLGGIRASAVAPDEVIVVDDASTDDSAAIARRHGATVLRMPGQSGPGAARNEGARVARGSVLVFIDADVVIRRDALQRVADVLAGDPRVAAVFGSYDDEPGEPNFVSQYKNLYHHFVHQRSAEEATTFWAGCGAVRRDVFHALGGFDGARYPRPSIEDIELGYRMRRAGLRIRLDKRIQGTHLKRWTFRSLLRADIFQRAVPWSRLILENGRMLNDLNLRTADRVSAGLACLAAALAVASPLQPWLWLGTVPLLGGIAILNREVYGFFRRRRGLGFAARALPMQVMYFLYSAAAFVLCWGWHRLRAAAAPASRPVWVAPFAAGEPTRSAPGAPPRGSRRRERS